MSSPTASATEHEDTTAPPGDDGRPSPPPPTGSEGAGPVPSLEGVPILVVEDDAPSLKLASLLLTDAGALVRGAASAEEAIVALASFRPRLIVLDLVLPRMGGLLLVEQLKREEATREIAVVAVTSLNGPESKRVALEAGCAAYIRKPIDPETFAETVANHVGNDS